MPDNEMENVWSSSPRNLLSEPTTIPDFVMAQGVEGLTRPLQAPSTSCQGGDPLNGEEI